MNQPGQARLATLIIVCLISVISKQYHRRSARASVVFARKLANTAPARDDEKK